MRVAKSWYSRCWATSGLSKHLFQEPDIKIVQQFASINLVLSANALGSLCVSSLCRSTVIRAGSEPNSAAVGRSG